ncbi:MAG: hypothetical protein GEU79_09920 [Acidimicrobiia bacterium]|nr:hypothetical protein [Acidimicrobiia bacterium]
MVDGAEVGFHEPLTSWGGLWHVPAMERTLDAIAARQHGCFSRDQARECGFSHSQIQYRLDSGAWIRLASASFAMASAPHTWERQLSASILSKPRCLIAGKSAAYLLGFEGFRRVKPEIIVPETIHTRSPIARVFRTQYFDDLHTRRLFGFTMTDPYETILHLAGRLSTHDLDEVVEDRLFVKAVTIDGFEPVFRRSIGGRVRGIARLAELLDMRRPDAWQPQPNQIERLLDELVDHPDVPPTTRQVPLPAEDGLMIVDTFINDWGLVLEGDGRKYHTRLSDFERDRQRDNAAAALGLVVLRYTWTMLTTEFDRCRKQLLETGRRRSLASAL